MMMMMMMMMMIVIIVIIIIIQYSNTDLIYEWCFPNADTSLLT